MALSVPCPLILNPPFPVSLSIFLIIMLVFTLISLIFLFNLVYSFLAKHLQGPTFIPSTGEGRSNKIQVLQDKIIAGSIRLL